MNIIADRPVDTVIDGDQLIIRPLGAGREVGRSCIYLSYKGKVVLFDCGILPNGVGKGSLPLLDAIEDDYVDLVLISHFHLDHCGALPVLPQRSFFHNGEDGKKRTRIFMTYPTRDIMKSLLTDYLSISSSESEAETIYTAQQLEACVNSIETINYHEERWHNGIKITCFQAGHVLGAAMFCVEIDSVRVLYTGDFSREEDRHLPAAEIPPFHPNVVIAESTYGKTTHDNRKDRENELVTKVVATLKKRGKILLPVFALGRTQELLLLLDEYWEKHPDMKRLGSIIYLNQLAKKSMNLFKRSIDMMNNTIRSRVSDHNPFDLRNVTIPNSVDEWLATEFSAIPPCVILCSPAMMDNGTSRIVLEKMAGNENNLIILTGYCMANTVARRLKDGEKMIQIMNGKISEQIEVRCPATTISFSAHSDFPGTLSFIRDTEPERVVLVHGEVSKMDALKQGLEEELAERINEGSLTVYTPENQKALKFRFNSPMFVRIVGRAAEQSLNVHDEIRGVLVKKDFQYQLMNPEDLCTFTQLKVRRILYREHFKSRLDLAGMASLCAFVSSKVELNEAKTTVVCDGKITVTLLHQQNCVAEYVIEWMSDYETDVRVDSLLMLVLQQDANILSPLRAQTLCDLPQEGETPMPNACAPGLRAEGKEAVVKEVLEEQFGAVEEEEGSPFWKIVMPEGMEVFVHRQNWSVECEDDTIAESVREVVRMVLDIM
ncbi:cleavage and polyadenylation specificity factor subunit 3 [Blastocystis sp. ATCC 50177/Nand II]|uniref:Cleavage and polyadenylation specificity factor subunit 3 n=1 Tax=Blastocystis sp. subtype 1 (strain ATCC 50177 / NandII) TaxID=478820 RepID=A0A196S9Q3_BLAHN|nr:cleavage and polyadenylation specificity factor subunit 3 [Blastocystis sp. ATCC 50177/Nand II]